jgi:hypothetical protein
MLAWAKENGWLIAPDDLAERIVLMQEVASGDGHKVWDDELTQRAVKLTKDTNGIPAFDAGSTAAYLFNLRLFASRRTAHSKPKQSSGFLVPKGVLG